LNKLPVIVWGNPQNVCDYRVR